MMYFLYATGTGPILSAWAPLSLSYNGRMGVPIRPSMDGTLLQGSSTAKVPGGSSVDPHESTWMLESRMYISLTPIRRALALRW